MRWIAIAAGVLLVASLVGSEEQAAQEESPLIYTLEVNGQPYLIESGKLVTLPAQKGPLKVRLKVEPYRVFRAPGVEFRFLRGWHLDRRGKEDWHLFGMRRCHLYVSMFRGERDAAKVIEREIALVPRFPPEDRRFGKVIRDDRPLRLAGNKVAGTTYVPADNPVVTVHTYYAVCTGPDTVLFTFWELRRLPGEPSKEWKEMERWLQESLKVLPPTDK